MSENFKGFTRGDIALKKVNKDKDKQDKLFFEVKPEKVKPLTLKFSADYHKLPLNWPDTHALLISVTIINLKELSLWVPGFIEYDTLFRDKGGRYHFNFVWGLLLTFIHEGGKPFTTIRRYTPDKERFYRCNILKSFKLIRGGSRLI